MQRTPTGCPFLAAWAAMKLSSRPSGRIVTFYSCKGGTGRSMALANFAWALAANGQRVLAVDWDLEAPGLHRYFHPFLVDPELRDTDGLIDAFWELAAAGLQTVKAAEGASESDGVDTARIQQALEAATRRLDCRDLLSATNSDGFIDFIGA